MVSDIDSKTIECEVILLKAINDHIEEMVNFEILEVCGTNPHSSILFKTMTHRKFFNILLVDFLSKTDSKGPINQTTFLGGLLFICESPCFNINGSINLLKKVATDFKRWLDTKIKVDIWLPSLDIQTEIHLPRCKFLKMTGDTSKHNYLRAISVAEELRMVLNTSGIPCTIEDALLALPDFYERFHTDILTYHASTIAEFLNNIRWGIFEYLQPEFNNSIVQNKTNPIDYSYTCPKNIISKYAKNCYWELMNIVRVRPYMRKFQVTKYLKLRY